MVVMVEYFVILGHFVMPGHFKMVRQRSFLDIQAYMIFIDQYQENKDTKYVDFDMSFPPRDAGTSIKTGFTDIT